MEFVKMDTKGRIATQILIMLVVVVLTSAIVFSLVRVGVIEVRQVEGASVLNTEFIPFMREGTLVIKEFKFCGLVDEEYRCLEEKELFEAGENIHFRFIVESSAVDGEMMLIENYKVEGPTGDMLLEVDEKYNTYVETESDRIYFKDYLIGESEDQKGEYTMDLIVENPLLNKKVTLTKKFRII
jgi:hypothetical protein